jgi:hypothetical protein
MKMTIKLMGAILLCVVILSSSCKKAADTSPTASAQISFGLSSDNPMVTFSVPGTIAINGLVTMGPPLGTAAITWTSGIANISKFQFEAKKNGKAIELNSSGNIHVDLFALNATLTSLAIDTGTYKEIELRIVLAKSTSADFPFVLKGTYTLKQAQISRLNLILTMMRLLRHRPKIWLLTVPKTSQHRLVCI